MSGWLALWFDLFCKCTGRTRTKLTPDHTLWDLISVWAPAEDGNEVTAYAEFVAKRIGIPMETKLSWFVKDII